jgi:hypothetical protein
VVWLALLGAATCVATGGVAVVVVVVVGVVVVVVVVVVVQAVAFFRGLPRFLAAGLATSDGAAAG